jgi:hypothetical protein
LAETILEVTSKANELQRASNKELIAEINAASGRPAQGKRPSGLRFITWKIESDGNDPAIIASEVGRYEAYALQEVRGARTSAATTMRFDRTCC